MTTKPGPVLEGVMTPLLDTQFAQVAFHEPAYTSSVSTAMAPASLQIKSGTVNVTAVGVLNVTSTVAGVMGQPLLVPLKV